MAKKAKKATAKKATAKKTVKVARGGNSVTAKCMQIWKDGKKSDEARAAAFAYAAKHGLQPHSLRSSMSRDNAQDGTREKGKTGRPTNKARAKAKESAKASSGARSKVKTKAKGEGKAAPREKVGVRAKASEAPRKPKTAGAAREKVSTSESASAE